jgi:MoxR-like ATPase
VDHGYQLAEGLVRRVLTAWLRGDRVILVGQPGTGKTLFAGLLGRAMEAELGLEAPLLIPIRADFDEAEFIGYERLDGTPQLREFATAVLRTQTPLRERCASGEGSRGQVVRLWTSTWLSVDW